MTAKVFDIGDIVEYYPAGIATVVSVSESALRLKFAYGETFVPMSAAHLDVRVIFKYHSTWKLAVLLAISSEARQNQHEDKVK